MSIHRDTVPGNPGLWCEEDLWKHRDEPPVRAEIANRFLAFAKSIALRYKSRAESLDDLIQVANVGLMNAVDRYDPESGNPFVAFAAPTIHGELKRHFRDHVSSLRLPRGVYERIGKVEMATSRLRGELGREPETAEIARAVQCTEDEVREAWQGADSRHPTALRREEDEESGILEEHLGVEDDGFELIENRITTREALEDLDPQDRAIIVLRYRDELSQSQIANQIGCSQMQISRKLRQILDQLNESIRNPAPTEIGASHH
jgi:RNA polymerase sigma-B factor